MRRLFIVALGVASLGAWSVPPAFGAIKTKKAERHVRSDLFERRNLNAAKTRSGPRTVPYGTGVYKLIW